MLNYEEEGALLCSNGKRNIYVTSKKNTVEEGKTYIKLKGDATFQHLPDKTRERDVLYVSAPSGSGKSHYTREFIKQYHKMYPKRDVYVFSSLDSDTTLDTLKYLKRIKIKSAEFLETDLTCDDFKDALAVFDDTDCLSDKNIKKKVNTVLNMLLETGRHTNTSIIYTSHLANAGVDTKRILNESTSVTIFPVNMGNRSLKYLLETSFGFDRHETESCRHIEGRYLTIFKSYPQVLMTENEVWLKGHRGEA